MSFRQYQLGSWSNGLFYCFGDIKLTLLTFFAPCVTFGKTAEAAGEGTCLQCGVAYHLPMLNLFAWARTREKIREIRGIDGNIVNDCLTLGSWSNGLFYCLGDIKLTLLTFFFPCVTFGKTAEAAGEGTCLQCGVAYYLPMLNLFAWARTREKIREIRGIDGNIVNDCLTVSFCHTCSLVQEAREVEAFATTFHLSMSRS